MYEPARKEFIPRHGNQGHVRTRDCHVGPLKPFRCHPHRDPSPNFSSSTFLGVVEKVAVVVADKPLNAEGRIDLVFVNAGGVGVAAVERNARFSASGFGGTDARALGTNHRRRTLTQRQEQRVETTDRSGIYTCHVLRYRCFCTRNIVVSVQSPGVRLGDRGRTDVHPFRQCDIGHSSSGTSKFVRPARVSWWEVYHLDSIFRYGTGHLLGP